jgi:hypothetical protein
LQYNPYEGLAADYQALVDRVMPLHNRDGSRVIPEWAGAEMLRGYLRELAGAARHHGPLPDQCHWTRSSTP